MIENPDRPTRLPCGVYPIDPPTAEVPVSPTRTTYVHQRPQTTTMQSNEPNVILLDTRAASKELMEALFSVTHMEITMDEFAFNLIEMIRENAAIPIATTSDLEIMIQNLQMANPPQQADRIRQAFQRFADITFLLVDQTGLRQHDGLFPFYFDRWLKDGSMVLHRYGFRNEDVVMTSSNRWADMR